MPCISSGKNIVTNYRILAAMSDQKKNPFIELGKNFLAGGVGGACTVLVGHPFDTVKVRLQTMPSPAPGSRPLYTGALDCVKQTIAKDGFFALYRGMAAPLAGVSPLFALFFGGCALGRMIQQEREDQEDFTFIQDFNAGALAGVMTTIVMTPGERIKCLLQIQSQGGSTGGVRYDGPLDVVKKLYKEGGIRSIYRGTGATLLRDIPASGTYLAVYYYLRKLFAGDIDVFGHRQREKLTKDLAPIPTLVAGGVAGIANWAVCIPADVIKSRLQTAPHGKYSGMRSVAVEILQTEGPKGFFRGFTPIMLRAFPANAACFFGMEAALKLFG